MSCLSVHVCLCVFGGGGGGVSLFKLHKKTVLFDCHNDVLSCCYTRESS